MLNSTGQNQLLQVICAMLTAVLLICIFDTGYPPVRGPVCLNCKTPTLLGRCHDIDICEAGEVSMFCIGC